MIQLRLHTRIVQILLVFLYVRQIAIFFTFIRYFLIRSQSLPDLLQLSAVTELHLFLRFASPPVPVVQQFAALGAQLDAKHELHVERATRLVSISMIGSDDGSVIVIHVVMEVLANVFTRGQRSQTLASFG